MNDQLDDLIRFRKAIISDPSNSPLRQVYADWLEEQGEDEKAEFQRWLADNWKSGMPGIFAYRNNKRKFTVNRRIVAGLLGPGGRISHGASAHFKSYSTAELWLYHQWLFRRTLEKAAADLLWRETDAD